jgi:hypothetical protein|tara:strand:- start:324 stop:584 length:261 start_codon:yes stop_codon:yes gene_type:complete
MKQETTVEFRLVDDGQLPPIMITMGDEDGVKVVLNNQHKIWMSLHRKTIGGCAEALFEKINELLYGHLLEIRRDELFDMEASEEHE